MLVEVVLKTILKRAPTTIRGANMPDTDDLNVLDETSGTTFLNDDSGLTANVHLYDYDEVTWNEVTWGVGQSNARSKKPDKPQKKLEECL